MKYVGIIINKWTSEALSNTLILIFQDMGTGTKAEEEKEEEVSLVRRSVQVDQTYVIAWTVLKVNPVRLPPSSGITCQWRHDATRLQRASVANGNIFRWKKKT